MVPERLLNGSARNSKSVSCPKVVGIVPVRLFPPMLSRVSLVSKPNSVGRVPCVVFNSKKILVNDVSIPKHVGRVVNPFTAVNDVVVMGSPAHERTGGEVGRSVGASMDFGCGVGEEESTWVGGLSVILTLPV